MDIKRTLLIGAAVVVPVLGIGGVAYAASPSPAATSTTAVAPAAGTAAQAESEAPGAPETGAASAEVDGPGGHQDANGANVDHQFDGQE